MTALPPSTDFTGATVTEAQFKTALTSLRDYLDGLLGDDGVPATARAALDAMQDVFTTRGDIVRAGAAGVAQRLALGTTGQVLKSDGTDVVWGNAGLTLGTEQASTSGVAIDFTGIPAGTKQIIVGLVGVSTNGTSSLLVQIGDSGGIEPSGYVTSGGNIASGPSVAIANRTDGWADESSNAAAVRHGKIILTLEDSADNTWTAIMLLARGDTAVLHLSAGTKSLSGTLDRLRITTGTGADTFDAGAINIAYSS